MNKKLQNFFSVFLPQNYREFRQSLHELTSNQGVVAELLRVCCEEDDAKAMKLAFERILGKPEKVLHIKRTKVRMTYPDAKTKYLKAPATVQALDETRVVSTEERIIIDESNAPGMMLRKELDHIGDQSRELAFQIVDKKNEYSVAEVFAANVYAVAMRGGNLAVIDLLFNYLDGAVADVVRLEGEDTVMLENYADVAPYEAKQGDDGVWYVETEAVA